VKDLNSLQSCTEKVIFELFDNSLMKFGTKWWALFALLAKKEHLPKAQSWYPHLWSIHLLIVDYFNTIFIGYSLSFCRLCQLFWSLLQQSKSKCIKYKLVSEIIGNLFFVHLRMHRSSILVVFQVRARSLSTDTNPNSFDW